MKRALENQRAGRFRRFERRTETIGRAGAIDGHRKPIGECGVRASGLQTVRAQGGEPVCVPAHHGDVAARVAKRPGDEMSEASIAEDGDPAGDRDLLRDPHRGGERLDEDRIVVLNRIRNDVEIAFGQHEVIGKDAVSPGDPENRALGAVTMATRPAARACAARGVDLSRHSGAGLQRCRRCDEGADELVAQDPSEIHVPVDDLQIGPADSGDGDPHERLTRGGIGGREIGPVGQPSVEYQAVHAILPRGFLKRMAYTVRPRRNVDKSPACGLPRPVAVLRSGPA